MINNSKFGTVELNDDFVSDEPREIIFETVGEGGKEFESDYDKSVLIKKDVNISKSTKSKTIKAKHSPGKYVASNRSNIFHEPKCEWAKKIKKDRQVWFSEKRRASNKGYRAHRCVK